MQTHSFVGAPLPIPVASSPALLPLLQPRWAVLSAQTQTPASGPKGPRLCEVASLLHTPDPAGAVLPAAHTAGTAPSSGYCHSPGGGGEKNTQGHRQRCEMRFDNCSAVTLCRPYIVFVTHLTNNKLWLKRKQGPGSFSRAPTTAAGARYSALIMEACMNNASSL